MTDKKSKKSKQVGYSPNKMGLLSNTKNGLIDYGGILRRPGTAPNNN